ncbi:hypothetical protein [Arthrobacter sp. H16F315]|uniref:hypothetical protein n=1 Tax=Arthrobacter sp. H16F315 TaxID=2955314 RepID=UPI0020981632|nr:hypothetical protein [Arthrobacter sp. H16F315]MDD1477912.1 hypothetical protein [Arthrobacter sp. H16F315]
MLEPFEEHPLVAAGGQQPAMPEEVETKSDGDGLLLHGFLGHGPEPGIARLYIDPQLTNYVAFPTESIISAENPSADRPRDPSVVRVRSDATLTLVETSRQQLQAEFLQGSIVDQAMPKAERQIIAGTARLGPITTIWSVIKDGSRGALCGDTIACTHCGKCGKTAPGPDDVTYWC